MGSNTEKKQEQISKTNTKKESKEVKNDNFCYCKVRRAINKLGEIDKSRIFLLKY